MHLKQLVKSFSAPETPQSGIAQKPAESHLPTSAGNGTACFPAFPSRSAQKLC